MSSGDSGKNRPTESNKKPASQVEAEESGSKGSEGESSYETNESMGNQNAVPPKKPSVPRMAPAKTAQKAVTRTPSSTASMPRPLKAQIPTTSRSRKEDDRPSKPKAPTSSRFRNEDDYDSDDDSRSSRSSGSSYSREKSQRLKVTRSERVNGPSSSSRVKDRKKDRRRDDSDEESSYRSRSPSEPPRRKNPESKKSVGKTEDKPRLATLSAKDLGTSTFYVIPKPSRMYVVVREPETMEVFDSVKNPSTAWCPVTTFVDEREAEMFCRDANEMAYKRGEFRTPFPERGYVYYEVRHCSANPFEAEKFAEEMSEIFQKNRSAYNKRRMNEINERRGGYDRR